MDQILDFFVVLKMAPSAHTLHAMLFHSHRLTIPAASDYGFHPCVYTLRSRDPPTRRQLISLARAYIRIFESMSAEELHSVLTQKQLRSVLLEQDATLVWVECLNEW